MSTVVDVADAVVAYLNLGSFDPVVTATRNYVPVFQLIDLAILKVTVIPKSMAIVAATRISDYFDCTIDIGIQKQVDPDIPSEVDALTGLAEQIVDYLRHGSLDSMPTAKWLSIANDPVYAPEHLDQQRVFTSVVSVTYRVRR